MEAKPKWCLKGFSSVVNTTDKYEVTKKKTSKKQLSDSAVQQCNALRPQGFLLDQPR